jgi:hypothetical protein
MLWSNGSDKTSIWPSTVATAGTSGSTHLLSFNEPDYSQQANMTLAAAAEAYKKYMQPYAYTFRLGSPAITNGGAPMGMTWMQAFLSACDGCMIDFLCVHWYDMAWNVYYFRTWLRDIHAKFPGYQIWITEVSSFFWSVLERCDERILLLSSDGGKESIGLTNIVQWLRKPGRSDELLEVGDAVVG